MLVDLHAHTSKISPCCQIPAKEVVERAKKSKIDGIVLTNHYDKYLHKNNPNFVEDYIEEYYATKEFGKLNNLKVFFGIEVTMEFLRTVHLLIYGVEKSFLKDHPHVYDYSLEKLYKVVNEYNGTLIQAHPFRNGTTVLDVNFLHGIEVNCHPLYGNSFSKELFKIAKDNGLILTCGGDYHADTYRPICGAIIPDYINSSVELGKFLRETSSTTLHLHEPIDGSKKIITYVK